MANQPMKRIGVIGGGQLAWMMAGAAKKLDVELIVQTPKADDPAAATARDTIFAAIDDAQAAAKLAQQCDVITFENEFINLNALKSLAQEGVCFRPRLEALSPLLDKYDQRCYLQRIGLPVPPFSLLENEADFPSQFPVVLKARRHGYDGQGTFIIQSKDELEALWDRLGRPSLLLEEFIPFERELAIMAARGVDGEVVLYPVVETQQEDQVCRRVIAPADVSPDTVSQIETFAQTLLTQLQVIGIFGIEFFLTATGQILVNEIAPRTHNSGHYTLDACEISQFEMHLRTVAGLPLLPPKMRVPRAVMVNLLGYEHSQSDYPEKRAKIAEIPQTFVHWYGKTESRPGRKLGHVTTLLKNRDPQEVATQIEAIWYNA
nr:5-(carboxyamino)imidazole ribonucleotide synthase [Lusitaniella coriacea]